MEYITVLTSMTFIQVINIQSKKEGSAHFLGKEYPHAN